MACLVHQGGYETLPATYGLLMAWTQAHGHRADGPNREVYLQGPETGLAPAAYVTELQLPLQTVTTSTTSQRKERLSMEPCIVTKPAFTVVGLPFAGLISSEPYADGKQNNEIGQTWDEFNTRMNEVHHVSGPAIGLCFGMPNESEPWYIAGMEVERAEDVPAGMMSMSVPAQKYAVFECTLGTLGATYRHITEEWQPQTSFERAEAPDFELYDEEFDGSDPVNGKMYVYWPIK